MKGARKSRKNNKNRRIVSHSNDLNQSVGVNALRSPIPRLSFMPDQFRTMLRFDKIVSAPMTTGAPGIIAFLPTAAFDVDPVIGSPTMAGFNQFAEFYNQYRVLASKIKVSLSNSSATIPVSLYVMPTTLNPGLFSAADILSMRGNPFCKWKNVALLGGGTTTITNQMSSRRMVGSDAVLFEQGYASPVTTSPVDNWYWAIAWESPAAIASTQYLNIEIIVDLIFYDRAFVPRA